MCVISYIVTHELTTSSYVDRVVTYAYIYRIAYVCMATYMQLKCAMLLVSSVT